MAEDGVIKFNCEWSNEPLPIQVPDELKFWRNKMYQLKLIGEYADIKIGYGNISIKTNKGILISGTQTGSIYPIKQTNFSLVTDYNIEHNRVICKGQLKASSESLTHAAVYEFDTSIKAIIHIHNKELWNKLINKVPTTKKDVPYGTLQMANEIFKLFKETDLLHQRIIVMAGHEEGIIVFGKNLEAAGNVLLNFLT